MLPVTLQINPESLNFLNKYKKKPLSIGQQAFIGNVETIYNTLYQLKKQDPFEFTADNEREIARGNTYVITESLQERYPQEKISLEDLQTTLENELHISDKQAISFITLCLVEPVWLPGALSALACALLSTTQYMCSNQGPSSNFAYTLKAESCNNEGVLFRMTLAIIMPSDEEKSILGTTHIQFMINSLQQVKLLPIKMQVNFPDKKELDQFQQQLMANFNDWVLYPQDIDKIQLNNYTRWHRSDLCVIPTLLGIFAGLISMIILLALSITPPFSLLLLPPLGLAVGFFVTSVLSTIQGINLHNDQKKMKRPIHLLKQPPLPMPVNSRRDDQQTTSFFKASSDAEHPLSEQAAYRPNNN